MVSKMVALNAGIVHTNKKNNNANPRLSFLGRDLQKSHNSDGDVRIERNITTEANELTSATTSVTVKKEKHTRTEKYRGAIFTPSWDGVGRGKDDSGNNDSPQWSMHNKEVISFL